MDHFLNIYHHHAQEYHRMISHEDAGARLLPALQRSASLQADSRILDLGGGTGRIPLLLAPISPHIVSLDVHRAMLREQARIRAKTGRTWEILQTDMRALPIPAGWADVCIAGWSIGHLRGWYENNWQVEIGRVVGEMHRVLRAGGSIIILETLSTGSFVPAAPSPQLGEYYAWLENQWGFSRETISTDYQFDTVEQAVDYTTFFFGQELENKIRANGWTIVPEWTGLWVKTG
jgi:ubiquinone/menaquinone biosynthesis C-methylase UbiE